MPTEPELTIDGRPAKQCKTCRSIYALHLGRFQPRNTGAPRGTYQGPAADYHDECTVCAAKRARETRRNPVAAAMLKRKLERAAWHERNEASVAAYLSGQVSLKEM